MADHYHSNQSGLVPMDTHDETSQTSFLMASPLLFQFLLSTTAQPTRKVTLRKQ